MGDDEVLLLVRMGIDGGGRVDPTRVLKRRPGSRVRTAFLAAQDEGWLDDEGWVTDAGREEVALAASVSTNEGGEE